MHPKAAKCPFCGKVYRKNIAFYLLIVVLFFIAVSLLVYSFNQGQQQTRATQKELEEAARAAGIH